MDSFTTLIKWSKPFQTCAKVGVHYTCTSLYCTLMCILRYVGGARELRVLITNIWRWTTWIHLVIWVCQQRYCIPWHWTIAQHLAIKTWRFLPMNQFKSLLRHRMQIFSASPASRLRDWLAVLLNVDVWGNLQFTRGCIAHRLKRLKWQHSSVRSWDLSSWCWHVS